MIFMTTLAALFGYFFYFVEVNNQCLVKDGSNVPEPLLAASSEEKGVENVSDQFDLVLSMFLIQSVSGAILSLY